MDNQIVITQIENFQRFENFFSWMDNQIVITQIEIYRDVIILSSQLKKNYSNKRGF